MERAAPIQRSTGPALHVTKRGSSVALLPTESMLLKGLIVAGVVMSAIVAKESQIPPTPLLETRTVSRSSTSHATTPESLPVASARTERGVARSPRAIVHSDRSLRWFDGRPVKPDKVVWMRVTAYSPDAASCGASADGRTATMHCVTTNDSRLVASDPAVLPYGSLLVVPGYADELIVPVLDCGGAIKGDRLDVLFPTHEEAIKWGVRMLPITLYRYADGEPATDPRKRR